MWRASATVRLFTSFWVGDICGLREGMKSVSQLAATVCHWHLASGKCRASSRFCTGRMPLAPLSSSTSLRHRPTKGADDRGFVAADAELHAVEVAEPVEGVLAILFLGELTVAIADRGDQVAD